MYCSNHPGTLASGRCAGCSEGKCFNCLVDVAGETYCGDCKIIALQGKSPSLRPVRVCPEARECLRSSFGTLLAMIFVGLFGIVGMILGFVAIAKGVSAKRQIAANPILGGTAHANAGIALAAVGLSYGTLNFIATIIAMANGEF